MANQDTDTQANEQEQAVSKDSKLIRPTRKYFYPESGVTRTRAVAAPTVKTKSTNEENK